MKKLSSLELHYLVKEFQILKDARIYKIYQPDITSLFIQFHVPNLGKKILTIQLPNLIYFTEEKETSENPLQFCMLLRKYLTNTRLREINQVNFERILQLTFQTKQGKFHLIIELFSKGNIILTSEDYKIIGVLEEQYWKDRTLKRNETYKFPKSIINIFKLTEKQLKEVIGNSKRDSIVKTLAIELSIGGLFAEELCLLNNINKIKKKVDDNEIKKIYNSIKKLIKNKTKPQIILEENKLVDIIPFELDYYKNYEKQSQKTFNEALENGLKLIIKKKENKQITKIKFIIEQQKKKINQLGKQIKENHQKGELIYEQYQLINSILTELKEIREQHSWKEIKEKLKNHKLIKDINEKEGKITISLTQ